MKNKILTYLFLFAVLLLFFQYMNQKSIFEKQEEKITSLRENTVKFRDSIVVLQDRIADLNYFTLKGNDNAMTYIENLGLEVNEVEEMVSNAIYDRNTEEDGNPLVPFEGYGAMRVNKIKFLNHRWILADFSNGKQWGDMVLEYFFDEKIELSITPVASVLYPY